LVRLRSETYARIRSDQTVTALVLGLLDVQCQVEYIKQQSEESGQASVEDYVEDNDFNCKL